MRLVLQLWHSGAMVASYHVMKDQCHFAANAPFTETFMTPQELASKHQNFQVIPSLLWSW